MQYDKTQPEIIVLKNDKIIIRKEKQEIEDENTRELNENGICKVHIMQNRKVCTIKRKVEK